MERLAAQGAIEHELQSMNMSVKRGKIVVAPDVVAHKAQWPDLDINPDLFETLVPRTGDQILAGFLAATGQEIEHASASLALDGEQMAIAHDDRLRGGPNVGRVAHMRRW